MAKLSINAGATSQTVNVFIQDSSQTNGAGLTGLVYNTSSLVAYYALPKAAAVQITLATLAAVTSAYTSGGFKEIDATNMPGWYRLDLPDAAIASGRFSSVHLKGAANMAPVAMEIDLQANAYAINGVAATSVTTINANVGTTQPQNFTGTAGSALVKTDMVDIAGAAVSTSTAQVGVNAVNLGGTTQTGRDIGASVLLSTGTGTGQLDFTSGIVKSNLTQILGTLLTETAGLLAGGFKKFFNIASPGSTMDRIVLVDTTTVAATATNLTNAPGSGDFTSTMKASLNAATPAVTVSDKTGFSLSTAGILAIWHQLTSAVVTAATMGKLIVDDLDAAISSRTKPADTQAAVTLVATTTNLTNAPTSGDLTATMKTSVQTAATASLAAFFTSAAQLASDVWAATTRVLTAGTNLGLFTIQKNAAFAKYPLWLFDSNGVPVPDGTIPVVLIYKDGATTGTASTNPADATVSGLSYVALTGTELNALTALVVATGAGATWRSIVTPQR